jgi:hypothetical protein
VLEGGDGAFHAEDDAEENGVNPAKRLRVADIDISRYEQV